MKWFTSDVHLAHKNIIDYCDRPFRKADGQFDTPAMTEQFVKNFCSVLKPGDELYILGDLAFDPIEARSFLNAIPGAKFMVWGNHDPKKKERKKLEGAFVRTENVMEIRLKNEQKAVLCHYPMLRWNKGHFGSYMLHGHCHGELKLPYPMRCLDVGVDCTNGKHRKYFPWSEDEIIEHMEQIQLINHHGMREKE